PDLLAPRAPRLPLLDRSVEPGRQQAVLVEPREPPRLVEVAPRAVAPLGAQLEAGPRRGGRNGRRALDGRRRRRAVGARRRGEPARGEAEARSEREGREHGEDGRARLAREERLELERD